MKVIFEGVMIGCRGERFCFLQLTLGEKVEERLRNAALEASQCSASSGPSLGALGCIWSFTMFLGGQYICVVNQFSCPVLPTHSTLQIKRAELVDAKEG